uniref:F-box domain-containing protein n=1 Tax=Oryza punctata TaxID=4537 RepID=A0A0E0LVM7_ORYPU
MADVQSPPPPSRQRRSVRPAMDALGSLPLDVLDNILSRLHIYDVVRSSALSRAWRRRWESLPTVGLLNSPGISASDVDALLLRRTAAARSFRLATRDRSWSLTAFHNWLLHLHRRGGLRDLELTLRYEFMYQKLNSCLFSFRDLTSLRLYCCGLPHLPAEFAGFPNLKTLHLSMVQVQSPGGRGIATLITASPVLQEASLIDAKLIGDGPDEDWVIRASNLRKLTIALGHKYGGRIEDIARLEECCLFGPNYAKYLMRMAHVTKLSFYCNSILGCTEGAKEFEANNEFLNDQLTDDMFVKLHVVRLKNISCVRNEMHFMEFVLSKARLLRKLYVRLSFYAVCSNEEAVVDVTEYPRTSSDAQVIFMGRESESLLNECNAIVDTSTEDTVDEVEETRTNSGLSSDVFPDITAPHQVSKLFLLADGNVALSEERGIDCPEFPDITALHQAILREGDTTDPVSNGAGNAHMFSEEGHLVNHVANRAMSEIGRRQTLIPSSMVLSVPCRSGADHIHTK